VRQHIEDVEQLRVVELRDRGLHHRWERRGRRDRRIRVEQQEATKRRPHRRRIPESGNDDLRPLVLWELRDDCLSAAGSQDMAGEYGAHLTAAELAAEQPDGVGLKARDDGRGLLCGGLVELEPRDSRHRRTSAGRRARRHACRALGRK
jgi:hypothetical protein